MSNPIAEDILAHIGMPRRSGRYPWGSGDDPYQHGSRDFLGRVDELKKSGWKETPENIMEEFGLTTTQYRIEKSLAKDERRMLEVAKIKSLKADGLTDSEIGRRLGINESSVRSKLNANSESRMMQAKNTADHLMKLVDERGMIDVGKGVNIDLGVSEGKMKTALALCEREGYLTFKNGIPQINNPGKQINQVVLCPPDTPYKINDKGDRVSAEVFKFDQIHSVTDYTSHDGGQTFDKFVYPKSMDSKRLKILLADEAGPDGALGVERDGLIMIRRGVDDLSLGKDHYSQVRILVDDKKYIKGMAVYSDNMPEGKDVLFYTNKSSQDKALKSIKDDPENPFGSLIKPNGQNYYIDKDGNRQLGLINKRAEEGDWTEWKDALPSQFLGKQNYNLAKKQLGLAKADKIAEFDEICAVNNPTIKKHLLEEFSNNCDAAAVHLKAAALPGQKYHVIIPVNTLKDNEIYAPNYENGTQLALIRYPHAGTFEIPIVTVNNKHAPAKEIIGEKSVDAVGINKKIADRLSGADFDGDTVMCIPTNNGKVKITSTNELEDLKGFDPQFEYAYDKHVPASESSDGRDHYYKGGREFKVMSNTNTQMGVISNLITDMTLADATPSELARAVRHSMVVIDAEKHKLDWKQSELDNDISSLKKKYQRRVDENGEIVTGGASTILSRAKGEHTINKRQGNPKINQKGKDWYDPDKPEGSLIYKDADDLYYPIRNYDKKTGTISIRTTSGKKITYAAGDKDAEERYAPVKRTDPDTGEVYYTNKKGDISYRFKTRTEFSTHMAETDDARTLISELKHPMESLYADYANDMKSLANKARIEMVSTNKVAYSAAAKATYTEEVKSLQEKLDNALMNAPRERAAIRSANVAVKDYKERNPDAKKDDIRKAGSQNLTKYRAEYASIARRNRNIDITDREWEAIQAGAISETKLKKILANTDVDKLRERATPRTTTTLSAAKMSKIKSMSASNKYSLAEIAQACGCSTATVSKYLKGEN